MNGGFKAGLIAMLTSSRIQAYHLCIVVKHFLKMRDHPAQVGSIPGKAASNMVVNTTHCHFCKGMGNGLYGMGIPGQEMVMKQIAVPNRQGKLGRTRMARVGNRCHRTPDVHQAGQSHVMAILPAR